MTSRKPGTRAAGWILGLVGMLGLACGGKGGNVCDQAVQHVQECTGQTVAAPFSCDAKNAAGAQALLDKDCEQVQGAAARSTSSWWDPFSWFSDPVCEEDWLTEKDQDIDITCACRDRILRNCIDARWTSCLWQHPEWGSPECMDYWTRSCGNNVAQHPCSDE